MRVGFATGIKPPENRSCLLRNAVAREAEKLAPEHLAQNLDGKKESSSASNPLGTIQRKATGGNQAVQVRMMPKFLIPRVEYSEKADTRPRRRGIGGNALSSVSETARNSML